MLRGLARNPKAAAADIEKLAAPLIEMGRARRYRAGSGEADASMGEMKLVDWLRAEGYQILFVGGAPPTSDVEKHMAEVVLTELRGARRPTSLPSAPTGSLLTKATHGRRPHCARAALIC